MKRILAILALLGCLLILVGTVQAVRKPPGRAQGGILEPPPRSYESPAPPPIPTAENSPIPGEGWSCLVTIMGQTRTCVQELSRARSYHVLGGGQWFATYRELLVNSMPTPILSGHLGVIRNGGDVALLGYSDQSNKVRVAVQSPRVFAEGLDVQLTNVRITGVECHSWDHQCWFITTWD